MSAKLILKGISPDKLCEIHPELLELIKELSPQELESVTLKDQFSSLLSKLGGFSNDLLKASLVKIITDPASIAKTTSLFV